MGAYIRFIISIILVCSISLNAKNLESRFQYFSFQNENGINYIETYLSFLSTSINYTNSNENKFQGSILIDVLIKKK